MQTELKVTRGDSETFIIDVFKVDGITRQPLTPEFAFQDLWFTVKINRSDLDSNAVIQKHVDNGIAFIEAASGRCSLSLLPSDTSSFVNVGPRYKYFWDLQLVLLDGTVKTIGSGLLTVESDVTQRVI